MSAESQNSIFFKSSNFGDQLLKKKYMIITIFICTCTYNVIRDFRDENGSFFDIVFFENEKHNEKFYNNINRNTSPPSNTSIVIHMCSNFKSTKAVKYS